MKCVYQQSSRCLILRHIYFYTIKVVLLRWYRGFNY